VPGKPGLVVALTLAIVLVGSGARARAAAKAVDGVVNLNTATPEVLALLPGLGPAKIERILVYRRKRPFRTVDELVRIKGVGRRMVRALRPHLAVSGPTTATAIRSEPRSAAAALAALSKADAAARPPLTTAMPARAPPRAPAAAPGAHPVAHPAIRAPPRTPGIAAVPLAARGHCLRPP
jgi:competence protein ComEA